MRFWMMNISPKKDPHMVVIQKVISYVVDRLRTMECALQTGQDAKCKPIKKLEQEIMELKVSVNDFTSGCFQLTFIPGKSRMLPQGFDHTPHRK